MPDETILSILSLPDPFGAPHRVVVSLGKFHAKMKAHRGRILTARFREKGDPLVQEPKVDRENKRTRAQHDRLNARHKTRTYDI